MSRIVPVNGFLFLTEAEHPRNNTVCQIMDKAGASDVEILENGPAFKVRFGDGEEMVVFSSELRPWYPT